MLQKATDICCFFVTVHTVLSIYLLLGTEHTVILYCIKIMMKTVAIILGNYKIKERTISEKIMYNNKKLADIKMRIF